MKNTTSSQKRKLIPIIDLFAGPGGLGEGFSSLQYEGQPVFDIRLSIEKDKEACKTLTWRSFYRQFKKSGREVPEAYYEALRESDINKREALIEKTLATYEEGQIAKEEVRQIELGSKDWPAEEVDRLIQKQLCQEKDWVLIGGPPCQAYSNVGRSRVGGISAEDHRVYLYREYLRIIEVHKPAVFVMENVKGLLSAKVGEERVFDWMKRDLRLGEEYEIHSLVRPVEKDSDFLIKSEKYGVPQMRHRVILLGIRKDHDHHGDLYLKESSPVNLESVIGQLPKLRSGLNREFVTYDETNLYANGKPKRVYENLKDSNEQWVQRIKSYRAQIKQWGEIPTEILDNKKFMFANQTGGEFVTSKTVLLDKSILPDQLYRWYLDEKLEGVPNHEARSHLTQDLMRYLFAALYVKKYNTFPRLSDYAKHSQELLPDHANVDSGKFSDRFRVQVPDRPATTVTSHISKDGHYFIHYDPEQCRSLTVREAARVQTFPDNYLFRGSRTAQYHQVGNAVPPYLAFQISEIVSKMINSNRI